MTLARFGLAGLAVMAGLAGVLGLAAPAQAATGVHAAGARGGGGSVGVPGAAASVINSTTFAGYQATVATGSATTSAARFKVPALSCTSAYLGITPVAGVAVNNFATYSSAFLFVGCRKGKAVYFPALVVNGKEVNYTTTPVSAGDVIKVSATVTSTGTTVSVTDTTSRVTKKRTGPGASSSAAYIGDSDWTVNGKVLGVPDFKTLTFTRCLVDGSALASSNPAEYQRVNSSNVVQIKTGALTSGGTAFATHYKHS